MAAAYVNTLTIQQGTDQNNTDNVIDFNAIYGQRKIAPFVQLKNFESSGHVEVYLNDLENSFVLESNTTQIFNKGDIDIFKIAFSNPSSGAGDALIEIICSVV